jgi:hypothetical protein
MNEILLIMAAKKEETAGSFSNATASLAYP